jgi:hypothetical protein
MAQQLRPRFIKKGFRRNFMKIKQIIQRFIHGWGSLVKDAQGDIGFLFLSTQCANRNLMLRNCMHIRVFSTLS